MKYYLMINFKVVDVLSVGKTPKPLNSPLCTVISLIFFMKQYSFKNAGHSVKNNISTFCQVANQLLQQNSERYFFISVQLRGIYRFL